MGRSPCCDKLGLKKGPWTPEEDQKLLAYIEEHGHGNWRALPAKAGLQRCGKSCRLRWTNYLRPDIKRGKFSLQEEQTIIQLHALLGNRWSAIATHLPKRTDNEIKNYWNTHLKKRLTKMGIDPVTHKPKNDGLLSTVDGAQQNKNAANLSHMAQWESARLEAEARLVRQSKLRSGPSSFTTTHHPSPLTHNFDINGITNTSSDSSNNGTSIMPRCLDVLKVWNNVWQPGSSNSVGWGPGGVGSGTIGLGIDSPTSTLSFSENVPLVPTVGPANTAAVIEFMEHSNGQTDKSSNNSQVEQGLVKEEREQEWKTKFNYDNCSQNQYHYHNRHDHHGMTMTMEHSLSFSGSSGLNDIMESNDNDKSNDDDDDDKDDDGDNDDDDDDDKGHDHQSFMEGFTELLLGAAKASNNCSCEKSQTQDGEGGAQTGINNDNKNNNDDNNGRGCTSSSSCCDYYEDNKNYWNSILNLVNSSPSQSPMF